MTAPAPPDGALGTWTYGNHVSLLENGEGYYPVVFDAIANARQEVLLETFLVFEDEVGLALKDVLISAARRGARVVATLDGYGSPDLSTAYLMELAEAGVDLRVFDPKPRLMGQRTNMFRRLHRKIVVVDRERAFIGGINYSIDHLRKHGPESKQDYAVEVRGPAVQHLHELASTLLASRPFPRNRPWWRSRLLPFSDRRAEDEPMAALVIWRDNDRHRDDIEIHYRAAIRQARKDVLIANAYFFPGFRLVRELRRAARRGVRVRLILQGSADKAIVTWAARSLYRYLARAGVTIHEYCERPFHGKVAVIDHAWCTVGSSNLDPSSLSLNLEANLVVHHAGFARSLTESLERLIEHHCMEVREGEAPNQPWWRHLLGFGVFHLMRMFPTWDRALPNRAQPVVAAPVAVAAAMVGDEVARPPEDQEAKAPA
jgi:cardiolipin synthase A/B